MKLQTPVVFPPSDIRISLDEPLTLLGSCFADAIGQKLLHAGFQACVNPFGTLYNPLSIRDAILRLDRPAPFTPDDCVEMGSGAGRVCSFSHHTSFARKDAASFLAHANAALGQAASHWQRSKKVIISLGTVWCWRHGGRVVANCLKRPQGEFTREAMSLAEVRETLSRIVREHPGKQFIWTVSPIRHLADGAHAGQLSKATLLLGCDGIPGTAYFPAYEIVMDELRDYRFYAEDMTHPSAQAEDYIWERFRAFATLPQEQARIDAAQKAWRASRHRPLLED